MIERYNSDYKTGLITEQVKERIKNNLVHHDEGVKTKTIKEIIHFNLFTLFNFINLVIASFIVFIGRYENLLFLGAVVANFLIALFQEIKAKKTIDSLSLLNEDKVTVVRNSKVLKLNKEKIVLDDVIKLELGNQVMIDSIVLEGECLVNEAFITGEDTPQKKKLGDLLLSGSFLISGTIYARVDQIGKDNYISKISSEAKYLKKQTSVIMNSLNKFIKYISYAIIPISIIMFLKQYHVSGDFAAAILQTSGAILGMIPEGLVLLTSTIMAISVIRLGKYKVLVQDLYSIESLARVDVLCLDKTGTLTAGKMEIIEVIDVSNIDSTKILSEIAGAQDDNTPTMVAIRDKYKKSSDWSVIKKEAFSSDTKYSVTQFKEHTYLLGSPEFITKNNRVDELIMKYPEARLLLLAEKKDDINVEIAYLVIQDQIRNSAKETIAYLNKQQVALKIISGDNPKTVANIAKRVDFIGYEKQIDLSTVADEEIINIANNYNIFGRVKPHQKKLLIKAFQENDQKVAMIGDGVNDVLALKESDCSIAISDGSAAARNVSQLVLLNSDFSAIPKIIYEGRRVVNNLERSSTLFLMKTIYTILLVSFFMFVTSPYPLMPIHLSVNNLVTIGIPSFVLALEKNNDKVVGDFFNKVIKRILPASLTMFIVIVLLTFLNNWLHLSVNQISSITMVMATLAGFGLLLKISLPFNPVRRILFYSMIVIYILELYIFKDLIKLANFDLDFTIKMTIFVIANLLVMIILQFIFDLFKIKRAAK